MKDGSCTLEINRAQKITVDEDVFAYLQACAEPFVDTPNSVLRRLLGLEPAATGASVRRGSVLPQSEFTAPILTTLVEAGGAAPAVSVIEAVEKELADRLTERDLQRLPSGRGVRWRTRVHVVRMEMIRRGLLKQDSPRGVWEITDRGRSVAADAGALADEAGTANRTRIPDGPKLPQSAYSTPVLEALVKAGGSAPKSFVVDYVGRTLADQFTETDHQDVRSGGVRWQWNVHFTRLRLVQRGLMLRGTPPGLWEITDAGRQFLADQEGASQS